MLAYIRNHKYYMAIQDRMDALFPQKKAEEEVKELIPPEWMHAYFPDLNELRELLGKKAFNHMVSLAIRYPDIREALNQIGAFLWYSGLQDHGIATHEKLLNSYGPHERPPENYITHYLIMLMFGSPEIQTNEKIYKEHVRWSQHFYEGKQYTDYPNPPLEGRRLKIGYTCHFVTTPVSSNLLHPMLKAHNRDRVEVFLYSDEPVNEKTESARNIVEHWRDTYGMDTDAFCELVRKDGIDVLIELNGHCNQQRYHAVARRPVPVQVAWYNYSCTTGVPGMDYALIPSGYNIEHLQSYYSETIFHKKGNSHAVPIGNRYPPLTKSPFKKNGFITFCSFGQAHKVTREQILLWCEVLKRVPRSRFFMKATALGEPANRAAFIKHFRDGGINPSRLIMEGSSDYETLLTCYWRADIAFDTYPSNAGTTTIDASMQGVPVLSLVGDRYCSQVAQSIVGGVGHPELQCRSREEFVEKAIALAKDKKRLEHYRQTLRNDFLHSPKNNMKGYMTESEDSYFEMWQRFANAQNTVKMKAAV